MKQHLKGLWRIRLVIAILALTWGFLRISVVNGQIVSDDSPTLQHILQQGVLRVCVHPSFKPFSFLKESEERVGVDIDIAHLLATSLGVKLELVVPKDFAELIPMLREERCEVVIAGMTITFERALQVAFTVPYFDTGLSILFNKVKAGELGVATVTSYDELQHALRVNGKADRLIIAVTEGKAPARSVPQFFPEAKIQTFACNDQAAQAVMDGKAHLMVHDELFLKVWWRDHKPQTLYKAVVFNEPFKPDYYGLGISCS
jgi:polar amino acid transport system substrate-binding protein